MCTGLPKNRNRFKKLPIWLASCQFTPPSVVSLEKPPWKSAAPQPPTQPWLVSTNPMPSRLALPCASLILWRDHVWPPSAVFRIAPSAKFSSETKPILRVEKLDLPAPFAERKLRLLAGEAIHPGGTAVEGLEDNGLQLVARGGRGLAGLAAHNPAVQCVGKEGVDEDVACADMSQAVHVAPPSVVFIMRGTSFGRFVPEA